MFKKQKNSLHIRGEQSLWCDVQFIAWTVVRESASTSAENWRSGGLQMRGDNWSIPWQLSIVFTLLWKFYLLVLGFFSWAFFPHQKGFCTRNKVRKCAYSKFRSIFTSLVTSPRAPPGNSQEVEGGRWARTVIFSYFAHVFTRTY